MRWGESPPTPAPFFMRADPFATSFFLVLKGYGGYAANSSVASSKRTKGTTMASVGPESADGVRVERLKSLVSDVAPLKATLRADAAARIGIVIADGHPVFRYGLRKLLKTQTDFLVLGETGDGDEAVALATTLKPDILLLDFSMRGCSALDVLRRLREQTATRTIVLTAGISRCEIVSVLRIGARGVILKDSPASQLCKSVRTVFKGDLWLRRDDFAGVVEALAGTHDSTKAEPAVRLTAREREVLALVASGETNREVARKLSVTEDTVKHHITKILDKTGMSS